MINCKCRASSELDESTLSKLCSVGFEFAPATREFDLGNALACAQAASLSYLNSKPDVQQIAEHWGLHVAFLAQGRDWGMVLWNDQLVLIAFRGTDEFRDWFTNLDLLPRRSPYGWIHRGFAKATDRLWPQLLPVMENAMQHRQAVWLTGHSLGGAMAQVCTMRLSTETDWRPRGVYTFAQPRVGSLSFARQIEEQSVPYYRIVNNIDVVADAPTGLFRTHVGREIYLDARGRLWPQGVPFAIKARDSFNLGQPEFPSALRGREVSLMDSIGVAAHGMERYMTGLVRGIAEMR